MNKLNFVGLFVVLGVMGAIYSCDFSSESVEWDVAAVVVKIIVLDTDEQNLMDDAYEGNLLSGAVIMHYNDGSYGLDEGAESKAYIPTFLGLWHVDSAEYYVDHIRFGEFAGGDSYTKEMTLDLGNGESFEIGVKREFKWDSNGEPDGTTTFYLDGQAVDSDYITVISAQ